MYLCHKNTGFHNEIRCFSNFLRKNEDVKNPVGLAVGLVSQMPVSKNGENPTFLNFIFLENSAKIPSVRCKKPHRGFFLCLLERCKYFGADAAGFCSGASHLVGVDVGGSGCFGSPLLFWAVAATWAWVARVKLSKDLRGSFIFVLPGIKLMVITMHCQQFRMGVLFHDSTVLDHQDQVGIAHRG